MHTHHQYARYVVRSAPLKVVILVHFGVRAGIRTPHFSSGPRERSRHVRGVVPMGAQCSFGRAVR